MSLPSTARTTSQSTITLVTIQRLVLGSGIHTAEAAAEPARAAVVLAAPVAVRLAAADPAADLRVIPNSKCVRARLLRSTCRGYAKQPTRVPSWTPRTWLHKSIRNRAGILGPCRGLEPKESRSFCRERG